MKYIADKMGDFPVEIDFYYKNISELGRIGFIEIYRNGKFYSNIDFNNGRNIKQARKMFKIANKERIKRIIKNKLRFRK